MNATRSAFSCLVSFVPTAPLAEEDGLAAQLRGRRLRRDQLAEHSVVIEHRSRRLIHYNVTAHPSAAWTLQQLREAVGYEDRYRFLIHDHDCIFASQLDESIRALGITVLKSAPHSPKMNAICEHMIGTIRQECLDWMIPLSESHLRFALKSWIAHYNGGRPHMSLGPGVPDPPVTTKALPAPSSRHRRGVLYGIRAASVLGGLHHEYSLVPAGV